MLTNIEFFILEAFNSFRRSPLMTSVAVGIVVVSLSIFGFFLLSVVNLGNFVSSLGTKMDVVAYVQKDIDNREAIAIQEKMEGLEGVEGVDFIHKEDAWEKFKKEQSGRISLTDIIDENPLPNAFIVRVKMPDLINSVATQVKRVKDVDEVRYSGSLIKQVKGLVEVVRLGGFILVVLLSFATLLIVVNTIRLTVLARETEIAIMQLVGATNSFIRWPFIIEGLIMGILGGTFSIILLKFSYDIIISRLQESLPFLPLVTNLIILRIVYLMVLVLGTLLGMLGGYISVSKILKDEKG